MSTDANRDRLWTCAGLLMAAYGLLVLLDVLAHEATWVGPALIAAGGLLAWTNATSSDTELEGEATPVSAWGRALTVAVGVLAAGGVLVYNAWAGSTLSLPEAAILAYGLALLLAAPRIGRAIGPARVETLVAWSLPLVAAPLGIYALDAALDAGVGGSPLDAFIRHGLVPPMAATLDLLGFDVATNGSTLSLGTPRGTLFLSVGLVCAGLQPGILFLGLLGLHTWREDSPPSVAAALLALGAAGVYLMNLVRLVLLAIVGHRWGGSALQSAHAHAGWVLFLVLVVCFWGWVLPRVEEATGGRPTGA